MTESEVPALCGVAEIICAIARKAFFVSRLPPANMSIVAQVCFFLSDTS
ncbi:hypothetical protein OROGR_004026 [Orobanche gracilis]